MTNDVFGDDLVCPLHKPSPILLASFPCSHAVKICLTPRTPLRRRQDVPTQCTNSSPSPHGILNIFSFLFTASLLSLCGRGRRSLELRGPPGVATQGRISCLNSTGTRELFCSLFTAKHCSHLAWTQNLPRRSDTANLAPRSPSTVLELFFISTT